MGMIYCRGCGKQIHETAPSCPECGAPQGTKKSNKFMQRSPIAVFFLGLVTFGIYWIFWYISTKDEMCAAGADIPTGFLMFIPIVNIYWLIKYSQGVAHVTNNRMSTGTAVLISIFLGGFAPSIFQSQFNNI